MDNSTNVTKEILTLLNVRYTNHYVKDTLLSHPDYPSLLAISDTLNTYGVNTLAVKVDAEKLKELPTPCIAQVTVQGRPSFCVLKEFSKDNKTVYTHVEHKTTTHTIADFLKMWTGHMPAR